MLSCTLKKHRLKQAAWLQMMLASSVDFSNLLRLSCEICFETGVEASQTALAIRLLLLLSLEASEFHEDTAVEPLLYWSEYSPYHLHCHR